MHRPALCSFGSGCKIHMQVQDHQKHNPQQHQHYKQKWTRNDLDPYGGVRFLVKYAYQNRICILTFAKQRLLFRPIAQRWPPPAQSLMSQWWLLNQHLKWQDRDWYVNVLCWTATGPCAMYRKKKDWCKISILRWTLIHDRNLQPCWTKPWNTVFKSCCHNCLKFEHFSRGC